MTSTTVQQLRSRLHEIIFEADTPAGKLFDIVLIATILASIVAVMLESVTVVREQYGDALRIAEWVFTALFTLEYALRIFTVNSRRRYVVSFYGLVDLAATLPTYVSVLLPGSQALLVIRALRLLRIFRVLKLGRYVGEAQLLSRALRASRPKIIVFLFTVLTLVLIVGTLMYLIEGSESGFTSIPTSIYWAVVTMTTVGYGDITPRTVPGQILATVVMIIGYGIIAVPTGIVSVEIARATQHHVSTQACPACSREGHDVDAVHCKYCGARLNP